MIELPALVEGLAFGAILGIFHFGGLWLTLRQLTNTRQPAILMLSSYIGRSLVCLLGFYLIAGGGFEGLIASIAGFVLMKLILINRLGSGEAS